MLALLIPELSMLLLSLARLSTISDIGLLGEPSIGGSEGAGGVNLPDLLLLRGEDLGDTVQPACCGGDTVHPPELGPGGVPQAELELEQELVRLLWATGGVPMLN